MTTVSEGETISNVKTVAMMMMPLTMMIAEVEEVKKSHPCDKEGCFEISLYEKGDRIILVAVGLVMVLLWSNIIKIE